MAAQDRARAWVTGIIFLLMGLMLLDAAGCRSFSKELDQMCQIASEVDSQVHLSPPQRATSFAKGFSQVCTSKRCVALMKAMAQTPASQKYPLLLKAARQEGLIRWSCPALQKWFSAPSSPRPQPKAPHPPAKPH